MAMRKNSEIDMKSHWVAGRLYDQRVRRSSKCFGKRSYEYPDAVRVVLLYVNRVALMFGEFDSYYCWVHGAWHVGHRGKRNALVDAFDRWISSN